VANREKPHPIYRVDSDCIKPLGSIAQSMALRVQAGADTIGLMMRTSDNSPAADSSLSARPMRIGAVDE